MYIRNRKKMNTSETNSNDIANEDMMKWLNNPNNKRKILELMGGTSENVDGKEIEKKESNDNTNTNTNTKNGKKILTKEEFIKLKYNLNELRRRKLIRDAMLRNKTIKVARSNGQASDDYVLKTGNEKYLKMEIKKADYLHEKNLNRVNFDEFGLLKRVSSSKETNKIYNIDNVLLTNLSGSSVKFPEEDEKNIVTQEFIPIEIKSNTKKSKNKYESDDSDDSDGTDGDDESEISNVMKDLNSNYLMKIKKKQFLDAISQRDNQLNGPSIICDTCFAKIFKNREKYGNDKKKLENDLCYGCIHRLKHTSLDLNELINKYLCNFSENEHLTNIKKAEDMFNENVYEFDLKKNKKEEYDLKDVLEIFMCKINTDIQSFEYEKIDDILPKNNLLSSYYLSYFVAKMKDESTLLLPFMVKLDKYLIKSYLYENYVNEKISSKSIKIDEFVKRNTNWNIKEIMNKLINSNEYDFKMNLQNKTTFENTIIPLFEKMQNTKKLVYECLDVKYMLEFYDFYVKLYGSENIEYINLIWDTVDSDSNMTNDYFININPEFYSNKIRKEDFNVIKEDIIQMNKIENFLFKLDDIYDFKEVFKYKLENCLQYHFNKNIEIEQILDYFKIFRDFNKSKSFFQNILYRKNQEDKKDKKEDLKVKSTPINKIVDLDNSTIREGNFLTTPIPLDPYEHKTNYLQVGYEIDNLQINNNLPIDIRPTAYGIKSNYNNHFDKLVINPKDEEIDLKNMEQLPTWKNFWLNHPFEKNEKQNTYQYTDLTDYYESLDNKNLYSYLNDQVGLYAGLDSYFTSPLENTYERNNVKYNKQKEDTNNLYIGVIYNKEDKEGKIIEIETTEEFKKILLNNFDIWFGNDFDMYKLIDKNKIERSTEDIVQEFKDKKYPTKNIFVEHWIYMESIFMKEKTNTKMRIHKKMEIKDCIQILNKYFEWNDNVEHRIRSTELSNIFLEKMNDYLGKMNNYIEESDFIPLFLEIVKELNLKKKRYSAGNFYYGIIEKVKTLN